MEISEVKTKQPYLYQLFVPRDLEVECLKRPSPPPKMTEIKRSQDTVKAFISSNITMPIDRGNDKNIDSLI